MFALITALSFGIGNWLLADVSAELGIKAIYPQCISCIGLWVIFHTYKCIVYNCSEKLKTGFFTKANSEYYRLQESAEDPT